MLSPWRVDDVAGNIWSALPGGSAAGPGPLHRCDHDVAYTTQAACRYCVHFRENLCGKETPPS